MSKYITYTSIDIVRTGERLNDIIKSNRYSVKELQILLMLSCPQPIYRWMNGNILPSVDNLHMLSRIYEMHMEDMLVARKSEKDVDS
ncbi:MAG: helix-turn-helix domain-containing protein [Ruminococcus flavefaciens]|nr:helix-turn-helix domain-containing protein [Ruminococcus flavefaciens]